MLFCLALEPLAAAIRKATDFPGVVVGGNVHKLDIILFVSETSQSIQGKRIILKIFRIQGELGKVRSTPFNSLLPYFSLPTRCISVAQTRYKILRYTRPTKVGSSG